MTNRWWRLLATLLVGYGLLLSAASVAADDVVIFKDKAPSAAELADIMFPEAGGKKRMRGINLLDEPPHETATAGESQSAAVQQEQVRPEGSGIGFYIKFARDSAELLPDTLPYIDRIGEMLRLDQAQNASIIIMGHTDAFGPGAYNQQLSERRAQSVKAYLIQKYGIASARLWVVGQGESRPLPGVDPFDGRNRRVEFYPVKQ